MCVEERVANSGDDEQCNKRKEWGSCAEPTGGNRWTVGGVRTGWAQKWRNVYNYEQPNSVGEGGGKRINNQGRRLCSGRRTAAGQRLMEVDGVATLCMTIVITSGGILVCLAQNRETSS